MFTTASKRIFSSSSRICSRVCRHQQYKYYSSVTSQADRIQRALQAKSDSGLSYDDLATKLNVTNTYAAQLLLGQAKLTESTAEKLRVALPSLKEEDIQSMIQHFPMRSYDDAILKEPHVYRTYEAITHYGEAMKAIINEQCGDGIMSAIDFYCDVGTTSGYLAFEAAPSGVKTEDEDDFATRERQFARCGA